MNKSDLSFGHGVCRCSSFVGSTCVFKLSFELYKSPDERYNIASRARRNEYTPFDSADDGKIIITLILYYL